MRIAISYPPLESGHRTPLLAQNRQFQWFSKPTYIYPMVPAYAATLLASKGHEVIWDDGIAERKSYSQWLAEIVETKPDLIAIETKTPVVKRHWKIIADIKERCDASVVLMGDHVTALPRESLKKSMVDFVLCGGDYDFLLLDLVTHLSTGSKLAKGIWHRDGRKIIDGGKDELSHDLNSLPMIDRELTKWRLYAFMNGNFKRTPGTYTMAGRDCWYHKCTFCSWPTLFPSFRLRKASLALDEIGELIETYRVKEIFDDTGCFPIGGWLKEFCEGMISRGYNKKVRVSCNMRVGALSQVEYDLMGKAGFRFILYGLESANQKTLDRIHKGVKVGQIAEACRMAKKAGLSPHLTCMVGYPWESEEDALKTISLAKDIFHKGWADTLQATIVIPYPGTPLYAEAERSGWLTSHDWDMYDMRGPVMKTPMGAQRVVGLTRGFYTLFTSPRYVMRQALAVRSLDDVRFMARGAVSVVGHLTDFGGHR